VTTRAAAPRIGDVRSLAGAGTTAAGAPLAAGVLGGAVVAVGAAGVPVASDVEAGDVDGPGVDGPGVDGPGVDGPGVDAAGADDAGADVDGAATPERDGLGVGPSVVLVPIAGPAPLLEPLLVALLVSVTGVGAPAVPLVELAPGRAGW